MGIAIFDVEDAEAARQLAERDPAVAAGVFATQVTPFKVVFN